MKKVKNNRQKWLHLRLTEAEHTKLLKHFYGTTQANLSDYARAILLGKPMIAAIRNQSLQDIMAELSLLRKDLNGVANNFNQAVHKLHTLDHIPEFKGWLLTYDMERRKLLRDIDQIRIYINETAEKWLQS